MTDINPQMKDNLLKDGYVEVISENKTVLSPGQARRKSGIYEYVEVLSKENDFKILHLKTIRADVQYKELSVDEAKSMLEQNHPVLKVVEQLSMKNKQDPWFLSKEDIFLKPEELWYEGSPVTPPKEIIIPISQSLESIEKMRNADKSNKNTPK